MKDTTVGEDTAYPSGSHGRIPDFIAVRVSQSLGFVMQCFVEHCKFCIFDPFGTFKLFPGEEPDMQTELCFFLYNYCFLCNLIVNIYK